MKLVGPEWVPDSVKMTAYIYIDFWKHMGSHGSRRIQILSEKSFFMHNNTSYLAKKTNEDVWCSGQLVWSTLTQIKTFAFWKGRSTLVVHNLTVKMNFRNLFWMQCSLFHIRNKHLTKSREQWVLKLASDQGANITLMLSL